jgi:flagellin-like protein
MKGISEIIAIILILMIVIALAALAYTWFSGIFNQMTTNAGTSVTQTSNSMETQFKIENLKFVDATHINATIRNLGTRSVNLTGVGAYYDGTPATAIAQDPAGLVIPSATATLTITMPAGILVCGKSLRVTIGTGMSDSLTWTC